MEEKYTPEIGNLILTKMKEGFSLVAAASFAEVGRTTVYDWLERYPDFKRLYHIAQAHRQAHWEEELMTTTNSARVTAGLKALGGMRSPDWSDDSRIEVTGANGAPLVNTVQFVVIDSRDEKPLVIDHDGE